MERPKKKFTVSMPPKLAEQVLATAKREKRTVSELMREAYRVYRRERVRATFEEFQEAGRAGKHAGYAPEEIPRLIAEVRREMVEEAKHGK